ncbi:MAG: DegT/DnrJ/EryC1/StrS family aminotransferase [Tannerellaceae bacterium]
MERRVNKNIQMVDLVGQYQRLKGAIDGAMADVLRGGTFINGPAVKQFAAQLADYLKVPYVIPCANGTDALQIALMSLGLQPGDEVIVPDFTYVAAAEVIALLGLTPVLVDVNARTFNMDAAGIEAAVSSRTKALIAVHLFGQCCDMESILKIAEAHHLYVIEDNAQSLGAVHTFTDGRKQMSGTMGHIGTTSFFPSKPLACYGDGGALITRDEALAVRIRMIANHGQEVKYHHRIIGCNSRLDTLQAAVLGVKLPHLDEFTAARRVAARRYDEGLASCPWLLLPQQSPFSTHVYHQYTLQVEESKRDALKEYLKEHGVPSMVYYPLPVQMQEAFRPLARLSGAVTISSHLCRSVLSLPIHTEMTADEQEYIIDTILNYEQ